MTRELLSNVMSKEEMMGGCSRMYRWDKRFEMDIIQRWM